MKLMSLLIEEAIAKNTVWHCDGKKIKGWLSEIGQLQLLPKMNTSPLSGTNLKNVPSKSEFNQKNLLLAIPLASKCTTQSVCIAAIYNCIDSMTLIHPLSRTHDAVNNRFCLSLTNSMQPIRAMKKVWIPNSRNSLRHANKQKK